MEEVRSFIAKLSAEDLRDIILSWASEEESSRRYEFLSKLNPPDKHEGTESEFDDLFDEVEAFALRVQNRFLGIVTGLI